MRYFSLATGEAVNPWTWFITLPQKQDKYDTPYSNPLPQIMRDKFEQEMAETPEDIASQEAAEDINFPGCDDLDPGYYQISLKQNGLQFWERAIGDGCEREFFLTPEAAMPYANAEGKKALSQFAKLIQMNQDGD
ncbi:hypothetical protein KDD30_23075 (plasmid) [Photobacterium sp. GJ3]|uniref:hypothetical protein n=1 Tax=Photobacterium sp. GJ3 TaxID=2829502 RepID=UPI001B8C4DB7|nr:hypothetical protein [Photobacterium sp. GJ3]QUJ69622.1 hypothetical protein KDD30_23075 [Photobacterium sp. GJ3]